MPSLWSTVFAHALRRSDSASLLLHARADSGIQLRESAKHTRNWPFKKILETSIPPSESRLSKEAQQRSSLDMLLLRNQEHLPQGFVMA